MIRMFAVAAFACATLLAAPAMSAALLTVIGKDAGGAPAVREFSREDLRQMPQISFSTSTEFTDGVPEFAGPLAREVIDAVGVGDATVAVMTAANDYAVEVPIDELRRYDVILATTMDGKRLSRRDKGPIWVMYPLDRHEELQDPVYNGRLIWQMVKIELK